MRRLVAVLNLWPLPVAVLLSVALVSTIVLETVTLPDWLKAWQVDRHAPMPTEPKRDEDAIPYAPVAGWYDRTPVAYCSLVFDLNDPELTAISSSQPVTKPTGSQRSIRAASRRGRGWVSITRSWNSRNPPVPRHRSCRSL